MSLTDTAIKALKPKASRYKVFDGGGLYLEILPAGSKVWRIKYRENSEDRRHTVGHYPATSLRDARLALLNMKALLGSGQRLCEPVVHARRARLGALCHAREMLSPGTLRHTERKMNTKFGQTFILPELAAHQARRRIQIAARPAARKSRKQI
ncbi:Arm DNA-binding domain-containing protein [uncultured Desulfovibrio sp.]|uniref:Arm DNA-binding domain-containing protein n=1 Tax=uncultured Desulfovibrio sp. TaxID=167968 RepID=UPI0028057D7A|nr:Arm DNA-binding domain-containing protein [uncultured Desulfovibrio sp.]